MGLSTIGVSHSKRFRYSLDAIIVPLESVIFYSGGGAAKLANPPFLR